MGRFLVTAQSMILDWSRDLTGRRQYQDLPVADMAVMTKAYVHVQQEKVIVQVNGDSFFVSSDGKSTM